MKDETAGSRFILPPSSFILTLGPSPPPSPGVPGEGGRLLLFRARERNEERGAPFGAPRHNSRLTFYALASHVQVLHFQCVLLDELAAAFDVFAHQDAEHTFGLGGLLQGDPQQGAD